MVESALIFETKHRGVRRRRGGGSRFDRMILVTCSGRGEDCAVCGAVGCGGSDLG